MCSTGHVVTRHNRLDNFEACSSYPLDETAMGRKGRMRGTTLVDRNRVHGLEQSARDPGHTSVGVTLPDDLDAHRHAFDR